MLPGTRRGLGQPARPPGGFPPPPIPRPADKERQTPVVGPDGDPGLPSARGYVVPAPAGAASRSAPRRLMKRPLANGTKELIFLSRMEVNILSGVGEGAGYHFIVEQDRKVRI